MDDSQGSSASALNHPAHLETLSVTVPCKTVSDALVASLSIALGKDLNSNVLDAFLALLRDPSFSSKDVTFKTAQDISEHISEQRKRIAQVRSLTISPFACRTSSPDASLTKNVYGGVPHIIIDLVARQLAHEMLPFEDQVDWDINVQNTADVRCPRERDLLSMALVHRTWTYPSHRALRSRVKLVGTRNLQTFFRSPRMGPWLREIFFVESLDDQDAAEMVRLLQYLLKNAPNVRKLCIRTWWRLGVPETYDFHSVVRELAQMRQLEALWLIPNRGHVACLPTLCEVLPNLRSLTALHIRNWMGGPGEDDSLHAGLERLLSATSSNVQLTTLSFVDGGLNETSSKFIPWLLRDAPLKNLEVHTKDICRLHDGSASPLFRALMPFLSGIETLRLHYSSLNEDIDSRTEFMQSCTNLKTLSLIVGLHNELNTFPESIETLHVHFSTIWPVSGKQLHGALEEQKTLSNLRTLKLTKDPSDALSEFGLMLDEEERLEAAWHIDDLKKLCGKRRLHLTHKYGFISFGELSGM